MKIRMLQSVSSVAGGPFSLDPGDIADVDEKQAKVWLEHGVAEPLPRNQPENPKPSNEPREARQGPERVASPRPSRTATRPK